MGMLGKGVGVLAKGIGSGTPSFVLQDQPDEPIIHPFRISARVEDETIYVKLRAGTVNNVVPRISGIRLDVNPAPEASTGVLNVPFNVYIKAENGSSPVFFPSNVSIILTDEDLADTDSEGYLLVGTLTISSGRIVSINQFVYASQVVVRAKPGDATALWLWSSR